MRRKFSDLPLRLLSWCSFDETFFLFALTLLATAASAQATTVTLAGSLTDSAAGPGWRNTTIGKGGFDITTAGVIGGAGYDAIGGSGSLSLPSWIAGFTANSAVYPGNGSYSPINNPATTGASPSMIRSGTLNPFPGTSNPATDFTFTLTGTVPSLIQIGLMTDNTDGAVWSASGVQLSGTGATGAPKVTFSGTTNDNVPDWTFFYFNGGVSGETFTVTGFGGIDGCACIGVIAFDSGTAVSTPEPAGMAILAVGVLGVSVVRRHRIVMARLNI